MSAASVLEPVDIGLNSIYIHVMATDLPKHSWPVLPSSATDIVGTLLAGDRQILLFGPSGVGKSTLAAELARTLDNSDRSCLCISADPGSPAFGVPGTLSLGQWANDGWQVVAYESLCTLDAGRFRLPLVTAVRRLALLCKNGVMLLDSPGVVRGVAGRELLAGLVEAAGIDTVLALTTAGRSPPLAEELHALTAEVFLVHTASVVKRPGKRTRARLRTAQWDGYLVGAKTHCLNLGEVRPIGTPPPLEEQAAWIGRQVALLKENRTEAMAEVLHLEEGSLTVMTPLEAITADSLLVRDAVRSTSGLMETAEPFAAGRIAYLPQPEGVTLGEESGGPRIVGRVGALDLTLLNGVFGDPLLHLRIRHLGRSMLFDLGDGSRLSARVAHQVSDVFISHAHMDHLSGFQWLLRSRLGEFPPCRIYGPPGLIEHVVCFINSFLWDRIGKNGPAFEVAELHGQRLKRVRLQAGIAGREVLEEVEVTDGVLLEESGFRVRTVQLDHHTPVLAYALELAKTLNVRKDRLQARGLEPGPWLTELKQQLMAGNLKAPVYLPDGSEASVGELGDELILVMPGKKLVYATDLADTPENREKLVALARNAHTLFCEATFSAGDAVNAAKNGHLTTRAAGEIATEAWVSRLVPFHFSRRYQQNPQQLYDELRAACSRVALPVSMKVYESPMNTLAKPPLKLDSTNNMTQKQDSQIRAILFDFGGVIAAEGFVEGLRAIARQQGLDAEILPAQAMDAVYDSGYVTGRGSEAAFWDLLRKRTGMTGDDVSLRHEILTRFVVRPWIIQLVRKLRARGYMTGILSDQTDWLDLLDEQQHFAGEFDHAFVSYRLAKGKRDASLFDDTVQSLGLAPQQVIFIDDAPGNIERACSCGMRGLLYTDQDTLMAQLAAMLE